MIQNLIFVILFLKIFFRAYNLIPHVPVNIIRVFFIPEIVAENLKTNKNQPKRSLILKYSFAQKTSLILRFSALLKLKITCSQNSQNAFSVYKFSKKHVSVWCQEKHLHCTISWHLRTTLLKHFKSKCLYISVHLSFFSKMKQDFIWWCGGLGEVE